MSFRRPVLFVLTMLLNTASLLICIPTPAMSDAEMECCKKMAGNCDMGGGDHKCCDTTLNHSAPTTAVLRDTTPTVALHTVDANVCIEISPVRIGEAREFIPVALSGSPPGFSAILRI